MNHVHDILRRRLFVAAGLSTADLPAQTAVIPRLPSLAELAKKWTPGFTPYQEVVRHRKFAANDVKLTMELAPRDQGTHHFQSILKANEYYRTYEGCAAARAVTQKIKDGLIAIGPPKLRPGEKLMWDKDGRYHIKPL